MLAYYTPGMYVKSQVLLVKVINRKLSLEPNKNYLAFSFPKADLG